MKQILYQRLRLTTNSIFNCLLLVTLTITLTRCTTQNDSKNPPPITSIQITPTPVKLLYKRGYFKLDKSTRILMNLSDQKSKKIGEYLLAELKQKTHYKLKIADRYTTSKVKSSIEIITSPVDQLNLEGFKIEIKKDKITIYAAGKRGLLYAANTILKLLQKSKTYNWTVPQVFIEDYPAAGFRGLYIKQDLIIENKPQLINWLINNRINNLIIKNDNSFSNFEYIKIHSPSDFKPISAQLLSIKDYYKTAKAINDTLIFTISNKEMLQLDSLAIIGEALWSKKGKRNYTKITNHLENRIKK